MNVVVHGRHCEVTERFRRHVEEKLGKVAKLDPRASRVDVTLHKEHNPRLAGVGERIELTVHSRGPVVRAEAAAADPYVALDLAWTKLEMRLRRAHERRVGHARTAASVPAGPPVDGPGPALVTLPGAAVDGGPDGAAPDEGPDEGPFLLREKVHPAEPMTLDQALYEMELVGHDFYLFVDAGTRRPSVVYRRRGYSYGVIGLDVSPGG